MEKTAVMKAISNTNKGFILIFYFSNPLIVAVSRYACRQRTSICDVAADLFISPQPQLNNDLQPKVRTKADRYSSARTAADSSAKAD